VKEENPFRGWLERDVYAGYWVPVGQLGGWLGPAACPALVRADPKDAVLASSDWPLQFRAAEPQVWQSFENGEPTRQAQLHPVEERGQVSYTPFVAHFDPFGAPSWLEPIQAFVLYWQAWPRHAGDGNVSWFEEGDDSRPDEIARWRLDSFDRGATDGTLEIRRDRLMQFLAAFDYDLAIYYEQNIEANQLEGGWRDEGREANRYWRCWATRVHPRVRAVLRAVTLIEGPPYKEVAEPAEHERLEFVIGSDEHGRPVKATCPPQEFLTPVFFREEVLERYYQDPRTFTVEEDRVHGGRQWSLPIARTGRRTVQAWLGDVNELPLSVQRHWQSYAVPDEGMPEWRLRRDFLAQFADAPEEGPVADLRRVIAAANEAAQARWGEPLFADIEETHVEAVRTLRVPANASMPAFLEQIRTLALLVVDHLNPRLLDAASAPTDNSGPLNRLARLVSTLSSENFEEAKERIGGLYAVQSVRSNVASHRTGPTADRTLARAGISKFDLPAGFVRLVEGATRSIGYLSDLILSTSG